MSSLHRTHVHPVRTLHLTDTVRRQLKYPVGKLVEGTVAQCNDELRKNVEKVRPLPSILVGDTISRNAMLAGIIVDVIIIDNLEKRHESTKFNSSERDIFRLKNAAGTINAKAWDIIHSAIDKRNSLVIVEGEEDLLALVAVAVAPSGSLVAYGQPDRGIVLVMVSDVGKDAVNQIIREMYDAST